MSIITEHESQQIEQANTSGRTPVVFIHGLWLLPSSWDRWVTVFEEAGYSPLTPGWPDDPDTVEEANANPDVFAHKTVGQVAATSPSALIRARVEAGNDGTSPPPKTALPDTTASAFAYAPPMMFFTPALTVSVRMNVPHTIPTPRTIASEVSASRSLRASRPFSVTRITGRRSSDSGCHARRISGRVPGLPLRGTPSPCEPTPIVVTGAPDRLRRLTSL